MLSASHNPMPDNGIKFFSRGGNKLDDHIEDAIERRMREEWRRPTGAGVGRIRDAGEADSEYVEHIVSTIGSRLHGLHVVFDGANGAACEVGPAALRALGAKVTTIGCQPDGLNINDGYGSTHLEALQEAVTAVRADAGLAVDGDADRLLAVDADGATVDGDQILAILALAMREAGGLPADTVVATVMSNLGFLQAMQRAGVEVVQTRVGDRYVLEAMRARGFGLGGEQSGHVIMTDHATTGDGILTGVHLLARIAETGKPLSELAGVMTRLPQVLINVPGVDKSRADTEPSLRAAVAGAEAELGQSGRVLLRPSGTEPLVRVMVEAESSEHAHQVASRLAAVVADSLAL
jgi:phosphoglucosamine mutase